MFAFEHYGIVPDMVVLGKGLGGAVFPMAALIARRDLDIAPDRALGPLHARKELGRLRGSASDARGDRERTAARAFARARAPARWNACAR
jgi:4-aminobutyrate aminotransferase